jgi:MFS family permease
MERVRTAGGCRLPRGLILAFVVLHCIFAGSFYGYVMFSSILSERGCFRELCKDDAYPCEAQSIALANVYTWSSVVAFATPLLSGWLSSVAGPRVTLSVLACAAAAGWALLLAMTPMTEGAPFRSELLQPAMLLIGAASAANYLPLLSVASLFSSRGLVLSIASGSFDAGSVVFLIVRLANDAGVPLRTIFIGIMAGPVAAIILGAMFLWRNTPFLDLSEELKDASTSIGKGDEKQLENATDANSSALRRTEMPSLMGEAVLATGAAAAGSPQREAREASVHGDRVYVSLSTAPTSLSKTEDSSRIAMSEVDDETHAERGATNVSRPETSHSPALQSPFLPALDTARLHALSWRMAMRTPEFIGFLLLFIIIAVRFNYFLASVFSQLMSVASSSVDNNGASDMLRLLGFLMPGLALPVVLISGALADSRGPVAALTTLSLLAVLMSALQLVPSLTAQVATFVFFVFMRGFLFANASVYLSVAFGFRNLGVLIGTVTAVGGTAGLLASSLMRWAQDDARGYTAPNALMLGFSIATIAFPAWLARRGGHSGMWEALQRPRLAQA